MMPEVQHLLSSHGVTLLFLLALLEGPVVVLAATALARSGHFDLATIWTVAILADVTGDLLLYALGRHLPDLIPARHRPQGARDSLARLFRSSGARLLLFAKFAHFPGLPTLLAAGFARMPLAPFLLWTLVGTVIKTSALVLCGWQIWQLLNLSGLAAAAVVLAAVALAGLVVLLLPRMRRWV